MGNGKVPSLDLSSVKVGNCLDGDPMCVERDTERSAATPPVSNARPHATTPPVSDAHLTMPEIVRPSEHGAAATSAAPGGSGVRREGDVKTRRTSDGWEYDFDGDPMSVWRRFSDMIRGETEREKPDVACFKPMQAALSAENPQKDSIMHAYGEMLRCADKCITEADARFLTGCVDWDAMLGDPNAAMGLVNRAILSGAKLFGYDGRAFVKETSDSLRYWHDMAVLDGGVRMECSAEEIAKARAEGRYAGWRGDDDGLCQPPEGSFSLPEPLRQTPAYRDLVEKLSTGYLNTHQCPQNFVDINAIKSMAHALLAAGYDPAPVPEVGVSCGYNFGHRRWYRVSFSCESSRRCFEQDREDLPANCSEYVRSSISDPLFVMRGRNCNGDASWRNGGSTGDARLIRIAPNTWIQLYETPRSGQFYFGLAFSDRSR